MDVHIHSLNHLRIHTHTCTVAHSHIHTLSHLHTHIHTLAHLHNMYMCMYMYMYIYMYMYMYANPNTWTYTFTLTYTLAHSHLHTCTFTHTHLHTYTYAHAYTYTYTARNSVQCSECFLSVKVRFFSVGFSRRYKLGDFCVFTLHGSAIASHSGSHELKNCDRAQCAGCAPQLRSGAGFSFGGTCRSRCQWMQFQAVALGSSPALRLYRRIYSFEQVENLGFLQRGPVFLCVLDIEYFFSQKSPTVKWVA